MPEERPISAYNLRIYLVGAVLVTMLGLLVLRLWQVQVLEGGKHVEEITRQSVRPIRMNAVRGRILAANGSVLVDNDSRYDLVFHVSEMRRPGTRRNTVTHIVRASLDFARLLDRPAAVNAAMVQRHLHVNPALPMTVFRDLAPGEIAKIMELYPPVPGAEVQTRPVRRYREPELASQILGWVGRHRPDRPEEMDQYQSAYIGYEMRGRGGLESRYDELLAGEGGHKLVRVDPLGYIHEEIGVSRAPVDGRDLLLTLDPAAQAIANRLLAGQKGALVVLEVDSGAVLALASAPTFSLDQLSPETYTELSERSDLPMLNRAVDGSYAPGSIIKPLIALAALECGAIHPGTSHNCTGVYTTHGLNIRCAARWGHGELQLVEAIRVSCNPYFIDAGLRSGLENIQPVFAAVGLGRRPGIDLPSAASGLLPTREYAVRARGSRHPWGLADTALISIGQGLSVITPLQAAVYTAAIANGGYVYRPFLVRSVLNSDGQVWRNTVPVVENRLPVSPGHIAVVRQGMYQAVNSERGSGERARSEIIALAGKTGTAEVKPPGGPVSKNTWFICFGPFANPRYACAILIEEGDSGGRSAAPLARQFFEEWLGRNGGR